MAKKEDTITLLSRYRNWLTVTPKNKDRRKAFERAKITNMEVTSKLMPKWMEIESKTDKNSDKFKSVEFNGALKQKSSKMMALVDKDLNPKKTNKIEYNPNRSVFNFQDFRHNVATKNEAKYYGAQVSQLPRKFFDWDDGKKFNPKFKKDI